jgi:methylglutaconyl-CoA hydratase
MNLVQYETSNRIGVITLNRPEKRNALNEGFVKEIRIAFQHAYNDEACKIIILKGSGDAFCAGADLEYLQTLQTNTFEENLNDSKNLMELFQMIYKGPKVVIAQIEGPAIAGGCGLATVCDFSFAVPEATFAYTEVKIGFIPAIVMVFLIRKIGEGKARELLLTGKLMNAEIAQKLGLINYIESKETIAEAVIHFAEKLCREASADSLRMVKNMIAEVQHREVDDALLFAASQNAEARQTNDCKRGIAAFLNKEKLIW